MRIFTVLKALCHFFPFVSSRNLVISSLHLYLGITHFSLFIPPRTTPELSTRTRLLNMYSLLVPSHLSRHPPIVLRAVVYLRLSEPPLPLHTPANQENVEAFFGDQAIGTYIFYSR